MSIMLGMTGVYSDRGLQRVSYTKLEELGWFLAPSSGEEGRYSPVFLQEFSSCHWEVTGLRLYPWPLSMKRLYKYCMDGMCWRNALWLPRLGHKRWHGFFSALSGCRYKPWNYMRVWLPCPPMPYLPMWVWTTRQENKVGTQTALGAGESTSGSSSSQVLSSWNSSTWGRHVSSGLS